MSFFLNLWTGVRRVLALGSSRRILVALVLLALEAARWRLLGRPPTAEIASFLALLGGWVFSESWRRHPDRTLATSQRFLLALLGQVLVAVLGRAGFDVGDEVVATVAGFLTTAVLGLAPRPHGAVEGEGGGEAPADPEDAPPGEKPTGPVGAAGLVAPPIVVRD